MGYYVIGKFVHKLQITGFRLLNEKYREDGYKDIVDIEMSDFKERFTSTSDKLLNFNIHTLQPLYQNIYSLPIIFKEEKRVSTYLPKAILGYTDGTIHIANVTGSIFNYEETEEIFKRICKCKEITGLAIKSECSNILILYTCQVDGSYEKKEVIDKGYKGKIILRGYKSVKIGNRNYVLTANTSDSYLSCSKGGFSVTRVADSLKVHTSKIYASGFQVTRLGMDGILFVPHSFFTLYHEGLEAYYNHAVFLLSDKVLEMRKNVQVGIFNELVLYRSATTNTGLIEIPDGVEYIAKGSIVENTAEEESELKIPGTVKDMSDSSFEYLSYLQKYTVYLDNEKLLKKLVNSLTKKVLDVLAFVLDCDMTSFTPFIDYLSKGTNIKNNISIEAHNFKVTNLRTLEGLECEDAELLDKLKRLGEVVAGD